MKARPHTAGLAAMGVSAAGLIAQFYETAQSCNGFESKFPLLMMGAGVLAQAFTKGVHQGDTDVIPKEEAPSA